MLISGGAGLLSPCSHHSHFRPLFRYNDQGFKIDLLCIKIPYDSPLILTLLP